MSVPAQFDLPYQTQTLDATATPAGEWTLPVNNAILVEMDLWAVSSGGVAGWWNVRALVKRGTGALTLVDSKISSVRRDAGASTWSADFEVTGDILRLLVTGAAGVTINWLAEGKMIGLKAPV